MIIYVLLAAGAALAYRWYQGREDTDGGVPPLQPADDVPFQAGPPHMQPADDIPFQQPFVVSVHPGYPYGFPRPMGQVPSTMRAPPRTLRAPPRRGW